MSSNNRNFNEFQPKKKPKNPIKFKITLNEEQKQAKSLIYDNPITVINGMAGSGKTLLATQAGLDLLFTKQIEKIIITRPTVTDQEIGFLPGDIKEKMDPWLAPIYHNFYQLYNRNKVDKEFEENNIEIVPFSFLRGNTFLNSFVIVDEAQNVTHNQMETIIGRLGKNSKMVICGDVAQIDFKNPKTSGFEFLSVIEEKVQGVKNITLKANHRHEIVSPILEIYKQHKG